jgi:hypothetical protein
MAVNKRNKQQLEGIELEGELLNSVSYATYFNRFPLFTSFRIYNNGAEAVENLVLSIKGSNSFILPSDITIDELPSESSLEVKAPSLLNPKYLADLEEKQTCQVEVAVVCGKQQLCKLWLCLWIVGAVYRATPIWLRRL